jgi:hypothetical protein
MTRQGIEIKLALQTGANHGAHQLPHQLCLRSAWQQALQQGRLEMSEQVDLVFRHFLTPPPLPLPSHIPKSLQTQEKQRSEVTQVNRSRSLAGQVTEVNFHPSCP